MLHLSDNTLRLNLDEPSSLLSYEKQHLLACAECRVRYDRVREVALAVEAALNADDGAAVNLAEARTAVARRAALGMGSRQARHKLDDMGGPPAGLNPRWAMAVAAALVVAVALSYAPVRSAAQSLLAILEPQAFTPVVLHRADVARMRAMPLPKLLANFGEMHALRREQITRYSDLKRASQAAHQAVLRPQYLPVGVASQVSYWVNTPTSATFTFDAKRAAAYAARHHASLPPMPDNLNGTIVKAVIGSVVVTVYGNVPRVANNAVVAAKEPDLSNVDANVIMVTQAPVPHLYSNGASVAQIESYLLSMPNVPPDVAAQIRAIGDPSSTLPVPIAIDKMNAQHVQVHGASGLMVGDNTGVGAVLLWQEKGQVHAVGGPYAAGEVLKVANSLAP